MAKKLIDYHLHTGEPFLDQEKPHAKGNWREYFDNAKNLDISFGAEKIIIVPGNSNHQPHYFGRQDGRNLYPFERDGFIRGHKFWPLFIEKNWDFRQKNTDALFGLEVDYHDDVPDEALISAISSGFLDFQGKNQDRLKEKLSEKFFDYLILSNHFVRGRGIDYSRQEFELLQSEAGGNLEKIIGKYFENILKMTELGRKLKNQFQLKKVIIGHIDLIKLIATFVGREIDVGKGFEDYIDEIFKKIKDFGLSLEYNTAGIKKGVGAYPDGVILKKAIKNNLDITFGSDSHAPYLDLELGDYAKITRQRTDGNKRADEL